jgi:uracil-DNA glycosylase
MYNQIVHIEGIDRTGKDTLRRYVIQQTKGKYLVVVRSFLSQIVYGRIFKRDINEEYFWDRLVHANLACDEKFIYLTCDNEIIVSRIVQTNEKHITVYDIVEHKKIFREVIDYAKKEHDIEIIEIDTSRMRVEDIYMQVQQHILNDEINRCNECDLCSREVNSKSLERGYGKLIPRINTYQPKYLIVGINPSNKRIKNSEYPFDVTADNNKNEAFIDSLKRHGIYQKSVITNTVKCSTETNTIEDKDWEVCKHHLETEVELFKPKYIICLGNKVYDLLKAFDKFKDCELIKIYHPSYQYGYNGVSPKQYDKHIYDTLKHTLI